MLATPSNLEEKIAYIENFFGDLDLIRAECKKYGIDFALLLQPEDQPLANDILQIQGTQLNNLLGSILACSASLFAFSMNSSIASQCTSLSAMERTVIAVSPLIVGSVLRIYSSNEADHGKGKANILQSLSASILGMIGLILILRLAVENEDLSSITSISSIPLTICGIFIGLGLGTYAAGMTLGASAATNNSAELWESNLQKISVLLSEKVLENHPNQINTPIQIHPPFLSRNSTFILRQSSAVYSAVIAGIANMSPFIPIMINGYADELHLKNSARVTIFIGIQLAAMIAIYYLLNDPPYDQLRRNNASLSDEDAKRAAHIAGQRLFLDRRPWLDKIKLLTTKDRQELAYATFLYSASYGVLTSVITTGSLTFGPRCISSHNISFTIALAVVISSAFRAIPLLAPISVTPTQMSQSSLLIMSAALSVFAFVDQDHIPESMQYIYAAFCGVVCYAVVARLLANAPERAGLITGASSGIGALTGAPLSLLMTYIQQYNPTNGTCPNQKPHETMSFQLLVPACISLLAAISLSVPQITTGCHSNTTGTQDRYKEVTSQPLDEENNEVNEMEMSAIL